MDVAQAARAAELLWQMWHCSGDPRLDGLLQEGIEAMERQALPAAHATFTRLIREAAELFRRSLAVHQHLGSARDNLRTALAEVVKLK